MTAISIVVPVYNTDQYLDRCIDSLLAQTVPEYEIILVDDGSTDKSPAICDIASAIDRRIRVIHKKNGGLSSARNAGISAARGQYIGFVDSDDTVDPRMYQQLYETALREETDFVMADILRIPVSGNPCILSQPIHGGRYEKKDIEEVIFPQLIMQECVEYGPLLSVCPCLYRTAFLRKHSLLFDEEVRWSEDNLFSALAGYYADSFYYLKNQGLYHYYEHAGSITRSYKHNAWDNYCLMNRRLHKVFGQARDYDFSRQLQIHIIYYACNVISGAAGLPGEEARKEIRRILNSKELRKAFQAAGLPRAGFKLRILLLLMRYRQTEIVYRFYRNIKKRYKKKQKNR